MRLQDQVALVTGGSRGIGRAIVKNLALEGAKVGFVFRGNQAAADTLIQEVTQAGGTALSLQGDVANPKTAPECVERLENQWCRLGILVNYSRIIPYVLFIRIAPQS